jgi:uncharacterized membrane protein
VPRRDLSKWPALLGLVGASAILYPLLAASALERWQPRSVAWGMLGAAGITLALRRVLERRSWRELALGSAAGLALIGSALLTNDAAPLLLFPALVNLLLAIACGRSLRAERSLIEQLATWMQPYLPSFTRSYCWRATALWTGFFALNAVLIAVLALLSPERWWPLYTSRIYFALVAGISGVEFLVRKLVFRNYVRSNPIDRVLAAIFPAENTERGRRSMAYIDEMRRLGLHID